MNQLFLPLLAFVGGIFLAIQGSLNAHLGVLLKNPLLASVTAFSSSMIFAVTFVLISAKEMPAWNDIRQIPPYLWVSGGFFSVLGISIYYYTIPRLGVSTMISLGLFGQLIFAVIAGHFGWFNLPTEPITIKRLLGVLSMITGILLINLK